MNLIQYYIYEQKESKLKFTLLYIGETRCFVKRHSDKYECSYSTEWILENCLEVKL